MKKTLLICLGFFFLQNSFAQKKWKPNLGIEFGFTFGGLTPTTNSDNPLVQGATTLRNGGGFSGGISTQFIKTKEKSNGKLAPSYGFQLKASYNSHESTADGVFPTYDDQTIKMTEIAIPVLFKVCLGSKEVNVSASQDADKYEVRKGSNNNEYEVWHHPGQYHAGYRTTRTVYFYAGPQFGFLNTKYVSTSNSYETGFESVEKNLKGNNLSVVGGFEFILGRTTMDFSYQKGLQTIYNGADVHLNAFIFKFGILF